MSVNNNLQNAIDYCAANGDNALAGTVYALLVATNTSKKKATQTARQIEKSSPKKQLIELNKLYNATRVNEMSFTAFRNQVNNELIKARQELGSGNNGNNYSHFD